MSTNKYVINTNHRIRLLTSPIRMINALIIIFRNKAYFWSSSKKRHTTDKLELKNEIKDIQKQMINKQLNTHFASKVEDSISAKILSSGRLEAYDIVNSFSDLLRSGILFSDRINWSLDEELAFTKKYLDLMKIRYDSFFDYSLQIEKSVECKNLMVPRLLIQNFTEKVIKKAFAREKSDRLMLIYCLQTSEAVEITNTINLGICNKMEKTSISLIDKNNKCMLLNARQIEAYNTLYHTDIRLEAFETLNAKGESIIKLKLIVPFVL